MPPRRSVAAVLPSLLLGIALLLAAQAPAAAAILYANGFETDTAGWAATNRVASGIGGIPSASGSFHATKAAGSTFTQWGGYNYGAGNAVPTAFQPYTTSIDIYLDVGGGWANNTRFDVSSAINHSGGTHLRDFIFNAGFYNDATGPGAGTDRFVISPSTNSQPGSAFAKNPANSPIAIDTTGWYTFETKFYDNLGLLYVDFSIYDATDTLVNSWTRATTDAIGGVGGNRYGWFNYNEFSTLAFDNAQLETNAVPAPEPASLALLALGLAGLAGTRTRRPRR
jgi:hypothetical protein